MISVTNKQDRGLLEIGEFVLKIESRIPNLLDFQKFFPSNEEVSE